MLRPTLSPTIPPHDPGSHYSAPSVTSTFYIPCISETMRYLSLCAWFISLNIMSSSFIHVVTSDRQNSIPLWIYTTFFFLSPLVVGHLFPNLGYCEQYCNEHGSANVSLMSWFHFHWVYIRKWDWFGQMWTFKGRDCLCDILHVYSPLPTVDIWYIFFKNKKEWESSFFFRNQRHRVMDKIYQTKKQSIKRTNVCLNEWVQFVREILMYL